MSAERLAAALQALAGTVEARRGADPASSYTAQLLADPLRAAKKLGEEAVEAAIAAAALASGAGEADALAGEAADVLYHWLVLMAACGVDTDAVAAKLEARTGRSGLDEKASRAGAGDARA